MDHKFYITLVRHGETMENREAIIQGQANTQLSDLGKQQASLVASRLQHEHFTHMYSSDLLRAADTAKAIVLANETSKCQLWLDKRLRERCFGVMEGKRFSELQSLMKELSLTPQTYTPENGETIEEVSKRARNFFDDICEMVVNSSAEEYNAHESRSLPEDPGQGTSVGRDSDANPTSTSAPGTVVPNKSLSSNMNVMEPLTLDVESRPSEQASNGNGPKLWPHHATTSQDLADNKHIHILIVSHGLLLKELKRLIVDRYKGALSCEKDAQNKRISPNTGVSKFALTAARHGKKIKVNCVECHFINCAEHLHRSSQNLVTEAKFQGAV